MDLKILHSWLSEYLVTKADAKTIAKCLSLCGPSIEKVEKYKDDYLYSIEVTTNRVDSACVYGLAREASVILPEFKIKAAIKPLPAPKITGEDKLPLNLKTDYKLVKRVMAVVLDNVSFKETPDWMKTRLETSGLRSLNSIVDITNYVMLEVGHPTHVFDYDLIKDMNLTFRLADKNEKITSFDGKDYKLNGGEIVIDSGSGEIVDLPGIIGTKNSVVNENTKRIVFFIDDCDPVRIRKASMSLGIRTVAATLNEKEVDPELSEISLRRGVALYQKICGAKVASRVYDLYKKPSSVQPIVVSEAAINRKIGVTIPAVRMANILTKLGFTVKRIKNHAFSVKAPSFRASDIAIPEDIIEEIARIYGYQNLPSEIMSGKIPNQPVDSPFKFENQVKGILKGYGATEIYTLSLTTQGDLKLKNPLTAETVYLRTSLMPSMVDAARENIREKGVFHLFEIANVYIPRSGNLPEEIMTLAGVMANTEYREGKGIIESLLTELHIKSNFLQEDLKHFLPSQRISIKAGNGEIGEFGTLEEGYLYYEFNVEKLRKAHQEFNPYRPIPQFPAQIEDLTLTFPPKTRIGEVMGAIKTASQLVNRVDLTTIYENAYTFRIWYQDPKKTLTDAEVAQIRNKILPVLKTKFGGTLKE